MKPIGITIKQIRKAKEMSLQALGSKAGVRPATIKKIEDGETPNPGINTVDKIAIALGLPGAAYFFDDDVQKSVHSTPAEEGHHGDQGSDEGCKSIST